MTFATHAAKRSDKEALTLATQNLALAYHVARKTFYNDPSLIPDMEKEAWIALYRAAQLYDASREATFATYAFRCIRRQLIRAWRRTRCVGHIPEHVSMAFRAIERTDMSNSASEVEARLHDVMPRVSNTETGARRWDARAYFSFSMGERSLSEIIHVGTAGNVTTLLETIPDEESASPEEVAESAMRARLAHKLLAETGLTAREREVIERRFLRGDGETLQEIADTHVLSRERIRQIEARALAKLRKRGAQIAECA